MSDLSLSLRGLTKRFGSFTAVDHIDLDLQPGELMALLGPSGCGKTTTLRMVAGLERPTTGEIRFGDRVFVSIAEGLELPPEKRNVGMVFQSYALWPHMTVFENISYPLQLRGLGKAEIEVRTNRVLELINLLHLRAATIPKLSGGQQQRVALARALVYEPSLMLFDEPFSNLDAQLRGQMRMELKALRRNVAMTGLFVTHDQVEALSLADRVAIMNRGRIEQVGTPQETYSKPRTRFVRDFLGRSVALHGTLECAGDTAAVRFKTGRRLMATAPPPHTLSDGDPVELSLRPEYIAVIGEQDDSQANIVEGVIVDLLFTGERFEARINVGEDEILLNLIPDRAWREGQTVRLLLPADAVSLWPCAEPMP